MEDRYYQAGVDLVIQAHVHNYERDAPIYKNETILSGFDDVHTHINPNAPIYITSGNAGNIYRYNVPASYTPQLWARHLSNNNGFGKLTIHNSTHLRWEQFSAETKEIIDFVWIIKNQSRYPPNLI